MKTFRYLIAGLLLLAALPSQSKEEEISVSRSWGKLSGTLTVPDEGSDAAVLIIAGSGPTDRNGNSGSGLITIICQCNRKITEYRFANGKGRSGIWTESRNIQDVSQGASSRIGYSPWNDKDI